MSSPWKRNNQWLRNAARRASACCRRRTNSSTKAAFIRSASSAYRACRRRQGFALRLLRQQGGADSRLPAGAAGGPQGAHRRQDRARRDAARSPARRLRCDGGRDGRARIPGLRLQSGGGRVEAGHAGQDRLRRRPRVDEGPFHRPGRDAGAADPDHLATQLVLLYDGAAVSGQLGAGSGAAVAAREMAALMLDAATSTGRARSKPRAAA